MTSLVKRLGISTAAVSKSLRRGESIAKENSYTLLIPEFCTQMAPAAHCREHFEI
jgi:hypothetical protein